MQPRPDWTQGPNGDAWRVEAQEGGGESVKPAPWATAMRKERSFTEAGYAGQELAAPRSPANPPLKRPGRSTVGWTDANQLPLSERLPSHVVRPDFRRCGRAGSYRRGGADIERFGADAALPDVLMALALCTRRVDLLSVIVCTQGQGSHVKVAAGFGKLARPDGAVGGQIIGCVRSIIRVAE